MARQNLEDTTLSVSKIHCTIDETALEYNICWFMVSRF